MSIIPSFKPFQDQQKSTTTTVRSLKSAIAIAVFLLKTIMNFFLEDTNTLINSSRKSTITEWLALALARIWSSISHGVTGFDQSLLPAMSLLPYLDITQHLVLLEEKDSQIHRRPPYALVESIATIVASVQLPIAASIEITLCLNLLRIAYLALHWQIIDADPLKHTLSTLSVIIQDDVRYPAMGTDLQVY